MTTERISDPPKRPEATTDFLPDDRGNLESYTEPQTRAADTNLPTIPGYTVMRKVGEGGMGTVYEALQQNLGRKVAIKILIAKPDRTATNRFEQEAKIVANLNHPHIVPVYAYGEHDNTYFIVMEYVEGNNLAEYLVSRDLPPIEDTARTVKTLAEAIGHAHQQGIIHRDLKPANVLLTKDEQPKITDFGLAKHIDTTSDTQTGQILGTPTYMAPEQAQGKAGHAEPAADVYALGVILYEMLTGRPPFKGQTPLDTLQQVVNQEPVPPRVLQPRLPKDLETICLKCLEKAPSKRYATAQDLADDLQRFLLNQPIAARPPTLTTKLIKWVQRKPQVAGAIATACVIAIVGITGILWQWREAETARATTAEALHNEQTAHQREQQAHHATQQTAYFHGIALAHHEWHTNNVPGAEAILDKCPENLRNWEWHYLKKLCHLDLHTFGKHTGPVWQVAISPDGTKLATVSHVSPAIIVWNTTSQKPLWQLPAAKTGGVRLVSFNPDSQSLATVGRTNAIDIWKSVNGEHQQTIIVETVGIHSLAYSSSGDLACGTAEGRVHIWNTDTKQIHSFQAHPHHVLALAWHPGGQLASASADKTIKIWDIAGQLIDTLTGHSSNVRSVSFSPNGQFLASSSDDQTVKLWEVKTSQELHTFRDHTDIVWSVAFSPSGQLLASGSQDKTIRLWEVKTQKPHLLLRGHAAAVQSLAFDSKGGLVSGSADGTAKQWDAVKSKEAAVFATLSLPKCLAVGPDCVTVGLADGTVNVLTAAGPIVIKAHQASVTDVALLPDGSIASSGRDHLVKVWTKDGKLRQTLTQHERAVTAIDVSQDGTILVSGSEDKMVILWNLTTGKITSKLLLGYVPKDLALSPDGHTLVIGKSQGIELWDLNSRSLTKTLTHAKTQTVAFSADGSLFGTGSSDKTVKVWTATGQLMHTLTGHDQPVTCVAFSADGKRLATGSHQTIKIWDTATGHTVLTLHDHAGSITSLAFSADNQHLASTSSDRTIRVR